MNIIISNQKIETKNLAPITPVFDAIFVSTDDEFEENNEFQLKEKNIKKLFDCINYAWDGEIYWFEKKFEEMVLNKLQEWFLQEKNHIEFDDIGIGNCFLIKKTKNSLVLIDTQLDMSSNLFDFMKKLQNEVPDITYKCYSDCHLVDHLYLGRNSIENEFEELYFLYKEKVIDSSFFLKGLFQGIILNQNKNYYQMIPQDKEIVITGALPLLREDIQINLKNQGFKIGEKINHNSWLWLGDKVGAEKIKKAQENKVKISTIDEIIEESYQIYLKNKAKIKNNFLK